MSSDNISTITDKNSLSSSTLSNNANNIVLDTIYNLEDTTYNNIDFIQNQINKLNNTYVEIYNELKLENKRYEQIYNEINNIYTIIDCDNPSICCSNPEDQLNICNKIVYTDTTNIKSYKIEENICMILVTMVAGGGAGGIGFIKDMFYYSGGGGGAGSCCIKKPIHVVIGTILNIKVGKGGNLNTNMNGEDSYIEFIHPSGKKTTLVTVGGNNGYSSLLMELNVDGGKGGKSDLCGVFDGCDGSNGTISIPSAFSAVGGNGGSSIFYKGGNGGGNYFNNGGLGGDIINIIGQDGQFGSGGGGSAPKSNIDITQKLSGNGGDGMVIIEW